VNGDTSVAIVSVGVSRMGKTRVVFIDPEATVNNSHYCDTVTVINEQIVWCNQDDKINCFA